MTTAPPPRSLARPEGTVAARWGTFCFRWRSYLPVLVVPVVIAGVAWFQHQFRTHADDRLWEIGCVVLAFVGLAIRVYTVGTAAPGTSGRNTREQKASVLNTSGAYSVVRHPLYVANIVIAVAFGLFVHAWVVPRRRRRRCTSYYAMIAAAEEHFLRARFGAAFDDWRARVRGFLPTFATCTGRTAVRPVRRAPGVLRLDAHPDSAAGPGCHRGLA